MIIRTALPALLLTALFNNAVAQKLPNKQEASLLPPANIKIDGKADEWGTFKAFNAATDIFYSIANDQKQLYGMYAALPKNVTITAMVVNDSALNALSPTDFWGEYTLAK